MGASASVQGPRPPQRRLAAQRAAGRLVPAAALAPLEPPAPEPAAVVPVPAVSFDNGVNVWFTSQLPVFVSGAAVGGAVTVGV